MNVNAVGIGMLALALIIIYFTLIGKYKGGKETPTEEEKPTE